MNPAVADELGVTLVSLEELFAQSDVVSIHTPWLPETEKMIHGSLLRSMRPGATLINTSRGAVIHEEDLCQVLQERPDLTAVLDVTHPEPPHPDSPLRTLENVILTPHIAGSMGGEIARMGRWMVDEMHRYLDDQPLQRHVPQEMLARMPAVPLGMEEFLSMQGAFLKFLGSFLGVLAPQLQGLEGKDIDSRLEFVRRDIAALPLDISPDLDAIAARHCLSLRQLNRLHTQVFSQNCKEYWDQLRAESARTGLANPSLTIKQVAHSLGFIDLAFFSNWFLRHELCRPREFRQRVLESLLALEA